MDIRFLVKLTSKAWSLKILGLLDAGVPGRQASLIAETQASRTSLASSLEHLIALGLVEKNPGHGHPLRPELRLTEAGALAGATANRILASVPQEGSFGLIKKAWTVPILAVTARPQRFSFIKSQLGTVTDRALSKSLSALEEQWWIRRTIEYSQRSPFPTYQAVSAGKRINRVFGEANSKR